ncbi:hypothetical protein [Microbulbifer sp. GL-2]|uniref:hypothetical protein n=1 Tax=Microbulbifer sp. GL-2 TaxID=2591606 RepID=UPI0011642508|nr:hypothetical protein [Microbulbifer sp. GL-2]BBM00432.1 hypothetical protein GL2_05060 [Microbulbifer sp. GL-2]
MKKKDFFFGDIYTRKDVSRLDLHEASRIAQNVSAHFFTAQLNRLLADSNGQVSFYDGTSHPSFWKFIEKIVVDEVGFIEIYSRQDINQSVKATLACDLILLNGIISITTHWCAYKEIRADEIISTLLIPLHLQGLQEKTYIRWDSGETDRLLERDYYNDELRKVFRLAKYPAAMTSDYSDDLAERYELSLRCATDVGQQDPSSESIDPWNAYQELLKKKRMELREPS